MKEYLVNYGYPLIYSTALPLHSLATIWASYETMTGSKGDQLRDSVFGLVEEFRRRLEPVLAQGVRNVYLLPSTSPIQALMIPGNSQCSRFCQTLFSKCKGSIRLFPIKSPTVTAGQERIRIILHANNTVNEVKVLVKAIRSTLEDMRLISNSARSRL